VDRREPSVSGAQSPRPVVSIFIAQQRTKWLMHSFYDTELNLGRSFRRAQTCHGKRFTRIEDATMRRVKQTSGKKRTTKAATVNVLGAAGLGLSLSSSASASTMPAAGIPQSDNTSPNQRFVLGEEEMADVSLATFHLFDRENVGSAMQLARGGCGGCGHGGGGGCGGCGHVGGGFGGCGHVSGGCGHVGGGLVGCRGCGGFRGCRGFRGCGCGGCGFGIGFDDDIWFGGWGWGYGGCCASWGACRLC